MKFANMPEPIARAMQATEQANIEACRNDPELMARLDELDICVVCMCKRPCLCEDAAPPPPSLAARLAKWFRGQRR
jgi:hypothetical protein